MAQTFEQQQWLKQIEDILEMLNEGVLISAECGRILFVNECMERLLGIARSVLIGKSIEDLYAREDYEVHWRRLVVETCYRPVRTIGGDFGLAVPPTARTWICSSATSPVMA